MVYYISGNDANNNLVGTNVGDRIYGFNGNDTLTGNSGNDALFGGDGSDNLSGGDGIDWLQGATGSSSANDVDTLQGGQGRDYYVLGNQTSSYYSSSGYAILRNYNLWDDYIVVADNLSFSQIRLGLEYRTGGSAADTVIRVNGDIVGIVEDVNIASLPVSFSFIRSNEVNQNTWL